MTDITLSSEQNSEIHHLGNLDIIVPHFSILHIFLEYTDMFGWKHAFETITGASECPPEYYFKMCQFLHYSFYITVQN
jgi:hypothetical protein